MKLRVNKSVTALPGNIHISADDLCGKLNIIGILHKEFGLPNSLLDNWQPKSLLTGINRSKGLTKSQKQPISPCMLPCYPLLFLLYINDLPNCLSNCEPRMYADDTHLTYAGGDLESIQLCLNEDLTNVFNWLQANKLTLNMTKTEFMLIGSRQRLGTLTASPTIRMNSTQVSQVTSTKSLDFQNRNL